MDGPEVVAQLIRPMASKLQTLAFIGAHPFAAVLAGCEPLRRYRYRPASKAAQDILLHGPSPTCLLNPDPLKYFIYNFFEQLFLFIDTGLGQIGAKDQPVPQYRQ